LVLLKKECWGGRICGGRSGEGAREMGDLEKCQKGEPAGRGRFNDGGRFTFNPEKG